MNLNEYQEFVDSVRLFSARDPQYPLLNLVSEVGELHGLLAKALRDGPQHNHSNLLLKELGDIMWSVAAIADDSGFDLNTVAIANVSKLRDRQARGVLQGSGDER